MSDKGERQKYIISALIWYAENGDKEAAKEVAAYAATCFRESQQLPADLADYLSEALSKIAGGINANRAFHLTGKRGRRSNLERDYEIAKSVRDLIKQGHVVSRTQSGNDACSIVAARFDLSEEEVIKIYYAWRETLQNVKLIVNSEEI